MEELNEIKTDMLKGALSYEEVFQKHIVDGSSYFFDNIIKDLSKEYKTKSIISSYFSIPIHEIKIVGSAKLGFSLNPSNLFNKFDSLYETTKKIKDKSDIDIAIISNELFDTIGMTVFNFTNSYNQKWSKNEYYFDDRLLKFKVPICYKFFEYYTKGWFRPDFKPPGFDFCFKGTYEEMQREILSTYKRKVNIGLYKNWFYFKEYHINNLKKLSFRVKNEIL